MGFWKRFKTTLFQSEAARLRAEEEARFHLEMKEDEYRRRGLADPAALARKDYGDVLRQQEQASDVDLFEGIENWLRDFKVAYRRLRKSPVFLFSSVLLLAVGLGVNAAVFSVMDLLFLKGLPLPDSKRLVVLEEYRNGRRSGSNPVRLADWRERVKSFASVASTYGETVVLKESGGNRGLDTMRIVGDWFGTLGIQPLEGRLPRADELRGGKVAVFTERARNIAKVGDTIRLGADSYEVIGVVSNNAAYGTETQVILPAATALLQTSRKAGFLSIVARLSPDSTAGAAEAEASSVAAQLGKEYPDSDRGTTVHVVSAQQSWSEDAREPALWIEAAAGLLLLITLINLAGLLAARAMERQRESSLRLFLGAGRWHLIRLHLAEAGILVVIGCAAALLIAPWALTTIQLIYGADFPTLAEARIDTRVAGFLALAGLASGLLFAIVMALQSSQERGVRNTGQFRLRSGLIVVEAALGLMLVAVGVQLVQDFRSMESGPRGFRPQGIVCVRVNLPWDTPTPQLHQMIAQGTEKLAALPGVAGVGVVDRLPLEGGSQDAQLFVRGMTDKTREDICIRMASPNYFELMNISLLQGEKLRDAGNVLVDENFASRYLAGNPLGRSISMDGKKWLTVVGVVRKVVVSVKDKDLRSQVYLRPEDTFWPMLNFVMKTSASPEEIAPSAKRIWADLSGVATVASVKTVETRLDDFVTQPRRKRDIVGIFGLLSLALVVTGVYGVMASEMARRTKEMGIRMAIGASRGHVIGIALRRGAALSLLACAIGGGAGYLLLSKWVMPGAMLMGALTIVAGMLLASFIPAWRVSRVDASLALRHD